MSYPIEINDLAERVHEMAKSKGFYDHNPKVDDPEWLLARTMLMVTELAEGAEAIRNGNLSGDVKSGGYLEELADCVIRILDTAESLGANFEQIIINKIAYNATREHKHGKLA